MPRNVRPSWINVSVEGRKSDIGTGPISRSGDLSATFKVRKDGCVHDLGYVDIMGSSDKKQILVHVVFPDLEINKRFEFNQ